jgi:hypothetical protein
MRDTNEEVDDLSGEPMGIRARDDDDGITS